MKKGVNIHISFTNRAIYTFIALAVFLVIGVTVFALTPGVAPNPGHLVNEFAPPANCQTNQVLQWDGVNWICANFSSGGGPSDAVMFFNLTTCPTGWSELTSARGLYMVGLPASGTLAGTAGTALTNLENRAVGQHNHLVNLIGQKGTQAHRQAIASGSADIGGTSLTDETQNSGSVAGTNAPYIQLLICQKD